MIRLYNSMTRSVEDFIPNDPKLVTMYVCGPTVYDIPHLGNARPAVIFDVLARLLHYEFGEDSVKYARNFTDIDDKIIARAAENGEDINTLTGQMISHYKLVMNSLGNIAPWPTPYATDYIKAMQSMIAHLIMEGHAYEIDGHVFFEVSTWPDHGILSGHRQEDLESGHNSREIKSTELKRGIGDFVMWKPSTDDQPGWNSPWGRGRPGWHIECSAMIDEIFGSKTIDIHGGGADLRFPHHECEISQFVACNHVPLAHFWVHNAMVTVDGQKMAKSNGNFITVNDVLEKGVPGEAIRLALMGTHYRSPLDWTDELVVQATQMLTGWHRALEMVEAAPEANEHSEFILAPLKNDLNVPMTISRIHEMMSQIADDAEAIGAGVRYAAQVLGLRLEDHDTYLRGFANREEIEKLVADRIKARQRRDWKESDRLRLALVNMGLAIEDRPHGTIWRRA